MFFFHFKFHLSIAIDRCQGNVMRLNLLHRGYVRKCKNYSIGLNVVHAINMLETCDKIYAIYKVFLKKTCLLYKILRSALPSDNFHIIMYFLRSEISALNNLHELYQCVTIFYISHEVKGSRQNILMVCLHTWTKEGNA